MNSAVAFTVERRIHSFASVVCLAGLFLIAAPLDHAQSSKTTPYERTFSQSKNTVEKALQKLQSATHGKLPTLDGFVVEGDRPLSQFQRPYYDSTVQVSSTPAGECIVRITAKVTAWYADSNPAHSGYQLLSSNGRLESDFLDQLSDLLNSANSKSPGDSGMGGSPQPSTHQSGETAGDAAANDVALSAPTPQEGKKSSVGRMSSSSLAATRHSDAKVDSPKEVELKAEAESLEDVLKNQAHPKNLVAVKKSGTPVVDSPSLTGKTLFLASEHDEFELLDFNDDWVHVRISGISRGWVWRTNLEMPEGISDVPSNGRVPKVAADLFQVSREEIAQFPGDWEALRGKNVKIISVQKIQEDEKNSGPQAKLEYAKYLLDQSYSELVSKSSDVAGVVLMYDSADGGMMALTLPTIQQWKAGKLTDAALWHHCYFDPPETFTISSAAGGH
jgi:hypothetical protein